MNSDIAHSNEHSAVEMIVRKMPFEFPDDIAPHWHPKRPEWSHMVNGASLAMPYLEPYLIRTMRKAIAEIEPEELKEDVKLYIGQEGQHFQQHRKFNDTLISNGYSELKDIEAEMKADFDRFEKNHSLKFNVAYACGFETMALSIGHWLVRDREYLFAGSDTRVASLILWHFVEEIEHKNVAFDVYQSLYGHYFYRVYATFFATMHVVKYSRKAYKSMLKSDGLWNRFSSRWNLLKMITRFFGNMIPTTFLALLPWHHPSGVKDPQWCIDWIKAYSGDDVQLATLDTENLKAGFVV
ncbi:MAG: metal-dependent hydrolase [Pseudomonadales bacterium]